MQTASTNICERMGCSQELSEFKHGTVIGCHLCNKSIREISSLLNIPRSTVSGIITKWKQLGTTATQPQSGRPRKITE
ncbi:helix-turn-helix domain-containing protein [Klebsiella pneumoniae]|nr:helix-turn-helix domain-containing protein [Klebsiella pneumoniae]